MVVDNSIERIFVLRAICSEFNSVQSKTIIRATLRKEALSHARFIWSSFSLKNRFKMSLKLATSEEIQSLNQNFTNLENL